jgi:CBS domain-containing protein
MSPRAAWRLERLGFTAHDYAGGKADWLAAGLPSVRQPGGATRALEAADRSPSSCGPDDTLAAITARRDRGPVVVITDTSVVLGVLTDAELTGDPTQAAEVAMRPGPATVRADEPLEPLLARMRDREVDAVLVTTPEGTLLGVIRAPAMQRSATHDAP